MEIEISPVQDIQHAIPFLAPYHHEEWQHLNNENFSIKDRVEEYKSAGDPDELPVMLVAHQGIDCFGSVRLVAHDMDNHPELSPWLASLYVLKEYRYQNIATRLIDALIAKARMLGIQVVYLYTEHQADYYQKRNWKVLTKPNEGFLGHCK